MPSHTVGMWRRREGRERETDREEGGGREEKRREGGEEEGETDRGGGRREKDTIWKGKSDIIVTAT